MKMPTFLAGIGLVVLSSCTDLQKEILPDDMPVHLTGRTCEAMHALTASPSDAISTPSDASPTPLDALQLASESPLRLPDGSCILANATGSLRLDCEELTYHNQRWEASHPLQWESYTGSTTLTAFYPVYPDQRYTTDNLYAHGTLNDVLYLHADYPAGKPIQLKFKHLFAQLNLRLAPRLQANLQKLEITCPHTVSEIDLTQGTFHVSDQQSHTDLLLPHEGPTPYSVILPSGQSLRLTLRIYCDEKTYTSTLTTPELQSGQAYTYTLTQETTPGIATVEDWIAFRTLLYNQTLKEYKGKTLQDFGKTVDGMTTYYLLNDLDFSTISPDFNLSISSKSKGNTQKTGFNDTFDGQGHTISHLNLQPWLGTLGLFTGVNSSGCIQNLRLEHCSAIVKGNSKSLNEGAAILAGYNYGIIRNCSVNDGQLKAQMDKKISYTGGLVGQCTGSIINCSVLNTTIECQFSNSKLALCTGGLAGRLKNGAILNCYVSDIKLQNKDTQNGGICGEISNGTLSNCYSYRLQTNGKTGLLVGLTKEQNTISNNFTEMLNPDIPDIRKCGSKNDYIHNDHYDNAFRVKEVPLFQRLNDWIDQKGQELFPQHTFSRWEAGDLPAQFSDRH